MGFLLGVEIDNSRIVWIYDSERSSFPPVSLTTVSENQRKAELKFYLKKDGKKHLICSETLSGLPRMHAGEPSIDIRPRVSGKVFYYDIFINGRSAAKGSQSLRPYLRSAKPWIIAGICAAVAAVILLVIFLLLPMLRISDPEPETAAVTRTETAYNREKSPEPAESETASAGAVPAEPEPPAEAEEPAAPEPVHPPPPEVPEIIFVESEITDKHSVYFTPDSAVLTADAVKGLNAFIGKLPKKDDFDEGQFELEVRGHCAKYGTEEGRAELSTERASNVYYFLKSEWGIEADSFVTGVGASEPVTLKRDEQHLNRRVDINIRGNITKKETSD